LQALRFKLNCLNQTCISLKSITQFTRTIFPDSAIFIEKKRVENRLWRKSEFLWRKKNISYRCKGSSALGRAATQRAYKDAASEKTKNSSVREEFPQVPNSWHTSLRRTAATALGTLLHCIAGPLPSLAGATILLPPIVRILAAIRLTNSGGPLTGTTVRGSPLNGSQPTCALRPSSTSSKAHAFKTLCFRASLCTN
jgi:hypothetical protein